MESVKRHVEHLQVLTTDLGKFNLQSSGTTTGADVSSNQASSFLIDPSSFIALDKTSSVLSPNISSHSRAAETTSSRLEALMQPSLQYVTATVESLQNQLATIRASENLANIFSPSTSTNADNEAVPRNTDNGTVNYNNAVSSMSIIKSYLTDLQQRLIIAEAQNTTVQNILHSENALSVKQLYDELLALRSQAAIREKERLQVTLNGGGAGHFSNHSTINNNQQAATLPSQRNGPQLLQQPSPQSTLSSTAAQLLRLQKENNALRANLSAVQQQFDETKAELEAVQRTIITSKSDGSCLSQHSTTGNPLNTSVGVLGSPNASVVAEAQRQILHHQKRLLEVLSAVFGFQISCVSDEEAGDAFNINAPDNARVTLRLTDPQPPSSISSEEGTASSNNNINRAVNSSTGGHHPISLYVEVAADGSARFKSDNNSGGLSGEESDNTLTLLNEQELRSAPLSLPPALHASDAHSGFMAAVAATYELKNPSQLLALYTLHKSIETANQSAKIKLVENAITDRVPAVLSVEAKDYWALRSDELQQREALRREGVAKNEAAIFETNVEAAAHTDITAIRQAEERKAKEASEAQREKQRVAEAAEAQRQSLEDGQQFTRSMEEEKEEQQRETSSTAIPPPVVTEAGGSAADETDNAKSVGTFNSQLTEREGPTKPFGIGHKRSRSPAPADRASSRSVGDEDGGAVLIKKGSRTEGTHQNPVTTSEPNQTEQPVSSSLASSAINVSRSATNTNPSANPQPIVRRIITSSDEGDGPLTASEIVRQSGIASSSFSSLDARAPAPPAVHPKQSAAISVTTASSEAVGEDEVEEEEGEEKEEAGGLGDNWFDN